MVPQKRTIVTLINTAITTDTPEAMENKKLKFTVIIKVQTR